MFSYLALQFLKEMNHNIIKIKPRNAFVFFPKSDHYILLLSHFTYWLFIGFILLWGMIKIQYAELQFYFLLFSFSTWIIEKQLICSNQMETHDCCLNAFKTSVLNMEYEYELT